VLTVAHQRQAVLVWQSVFNVPPSHKISLLAYRLNSAATFALRAKIGCEAMPHHPLSEGARLI
jgi:hypothetical protein